MDNISSLWTWATEAANQRGIHTIALIAGLLAMPIVAIWGLIKYFSSRRGSKANLTEGTAANRGIVPGQLIFISSTTEQLRAIEPLKRDFAQEELDRARKALSKGDMSEAEVLYQKVLDISSETAAEAAYQLGSASKNRFDYKMADYYYTIAIQHLPENVYYLNAGGEIKNRIGQYKEAEELLKRALNKIKEPKRR